MENSSPPVPGDMVQVLSWGRVPVTTGVLIKVYNKENFHGNESFDYKIYEVLCLESGQIGSYDEPYYAVKNIE